VVFNTGPYTDLPDNSILITANMQSGTGFPSSHQLKSYVASKSRPKLAVRAVLSADAGLLVWTATFSGVANWQQSEKVEHGYTTTNLPLSNRIKIVSVLPRLPGEIGRTISDVQKRDEQTNRQTSLFNVFGCPGGG